MNTYYILENKKAIPVTLKEYSDFLSTYPKNRTDWRRVALTKIDDVEISTVFLGINHNYRDGPPHIFETMVFGGELDQECERYPTWIEAEQGHQRWIEGVGEFLEKLK